LTVVTPDTEAEGSTVDERPEVMVEAEMAEATVATEGATTVIPPGAI